VLYYIQFCCSIKFTIIFVTSYSYIDRLLIAIKSGGEPGSNDILPNFLAFFWF